MAPAGGTIRVMAPPRISQSDRDRMLACLLLAAPVELRRWGGADAVRRAWAEMLDEQLSWCADEAFARLRADRIGLATAREYLQRVIDVGGARVLCGIRFYNLDPARPFVELIAWTSPEVDLAAAARAAMESFGVFEPGSARVFLAGTSPPAVGAGCSVSGDAVLCAETLRAIVGSPPPLNTERVTLIDAAIDTAEEFVAAGYRALAQRSPEIARCIEPADREQLAVCSADGRLAWWLLDGEVAGLIAVRRERWLGLDGYLMVEEVAAPGQVGKRTAAAAQRRLAESLAQADAGLPLFGTIDLCNHPSRRAAAGVGRREIGAWWFVRPG